jgi:hypothetical protein
MTKTLNEAMHCWKVPAAVAVGCAVFAGLISAAVPQAITPRRLLAISALISPSKRLRGLAPPLRTKGQMAFDKLQHM